MARISNYGLSEYGLDEPQSDSAVSAVRNNPEAAARQFFINEQKNKLAGR